MTKLIRNWEELAQVKPNDKYKIEVDLDMCCGRIKPIIETEGTKAHYGKHHMYLSTHAFYGKTGTPDILKQFGWDIELDNWDKDTDK